MNTTLLADAPIPNPMALLKSDAFPVLLADTWDGSQDLTGWIISEKLDGVRAYWDGEKFISRAGNVFTAPKKFTEGLPKVHLDGELFMGRGKFNECSGIVRSGAADARWFNVKFIVFDAPNAPGGFEQRIKYIDGLKLGQYAESHKHSVLESQAQIEPLLDLIIEQLHGEGIMARRPGSMYERRRSSSLLKIKRFFDMEAEVVGHTAGKGWRAGMTGAMLVKTHKGRKFPHFAVPAGVEFKVGCKDKKMCQTPPAVGTIITFKFQEVSPGGVPRFPTFLSFPAE
jgi:DNA ligase-1